MKWEYSEIEKAIVRIKARQRAQTEHEFYRALLLWYLELSDLDLTALSKGDWENLCYELLVLLFIPDVQGDFPLFSEKDLREHLLPSDLPDQEIVKKIQANLRQKLDRFLSPDGKYTVVTKAGIQVSRIQKPDGEVVTTTHHFGGHGGFFAEGEGFGPTARNLVEAVDYSVANLLGDYGASVRRCKLPECNKLFTADRTDQVYHSRKCVDLATHRRIRAEKKAKAKHKKTVKPQRRKS